jgi:hypothetical protein
VCGGVVESVARDGVKEEAREVARIEVADLEGC